MQHKLIAGVPAETFPAEARVALVPDALAALTKAGIDVLIESGAGDRAGFPDDAYSAKSAEITRDRQELFARSDVILQVRGFGANTDAGRADLEFIRPGMVLIGFHEPLSAPQAARQLAERGAAVFALELIPRISRAQSMDALSSMATVAGYRATLLAAAALPKMFPMMMTAAGTLSPARVLVLGAGVAGLQAIATAHRLGAVVLAYDVRPQVKEQVESLGARFVELDLGEARTEGAGGYAKSLSEDSALRQREALARVAAACDVVITTAAVPGKSAPLLLDEEAVRGMRPGSVIVDLAAEQGGNCALTQPGRELVRHGVRIIGLLNLASSVPFHASQMVARNISALLLHLVHDGAVTIDLTDEITRETLVTRDGQVVHPDVRKVLGMDPPPATEKGDDS